MVTLNILSALAGGAILGAAAAALLFIHQRVAGISGIAAGILPPWTSETAWRLWFLLGLVVSAPLYRGLGLAIPMQLDASLPQLALAGVLVGYGARLGGGCTSGHGVCGIARLSGRSLVATLLFMSTAGVVVFIYRHLLGAH